MIGDNMSTANLKNIYFQRSNGEFVLLEESVTQEDAQLVMKHFLDEHNYKSYYTRSWERNGVRWYDVGSWSEFFAWANEEDIERLKKGTNKMLRSIAKRRIILLSQKRKLTTIMILMFVLLYASIIGQIKIIFTDNNIALFVGKLIHIIVGQ